MQAFNQEQKLKIGGCGRTSYYITNVDPHNFL